MKKIYIILSAIIYLMGACSKEEASSVTSENFNGSQAAQKAENHAPEIVSATIMPSNPVSDRPLFIQLVGNDTDGDAIQYTYRWFVDGDLIKEGSDNVLEPREYKKGSSIVAEIIPSDGIAVGKTFRTSSVVILNQPPVISSISINPTTVVVGTVVRAEIGASDADGDEIKYLYEWKVNGRAVADASGDTLDTTKLHKKDIISVVVTPSDGESNGRPTQSGALTISNSSPKIVSSPPSLVTTDMYQYHVVATDPDGDKLTYSLERAPQGMTIDPSSGLIRWVIPKEVSGSQEVPVKVVVDDGDGGKATQEFSLTLEMK